MTWHLPPSDTYFKAVLDATPAGFELDHLAHAMQYVRHIPRTAVDGGAHIGTWSVALGKMFGNVMAFEPAPDTYECLTANLLEHKINNVVPVMAALGETECFCHVVDDPARPGNTGARYTELGATSRMFSLDYFALKHVDFIKLDLEGQEEAAIRGAMETLKVNRPVLMVELKEFNPQRAYGTSGVRKLLALLGYREMGGVRNDRVFIHANA